MGGQSYRQQMQSHIFDLFWRAKNSSKSPEIQVDRLVVGQGIAATLLHAMQTQACLSVTEIIRRVGSDAKLPTDEMFCEGTIQSLVHDITKDNIVADEDTTKLRLRQLHVAPDAGTWSDKTVDSALTQQRSILFPPEMPLGLKRASEVLSQGMAKESDALGNLLVISSHFQKCLEANQFLLAMALAKGIVHKVEPVSLSGRQLFRAHMTLCEEFSLASPMQYDNEEGNFSTKKSLPMQRKKSCRTLDLKIYASSVDFCTGLGSPKLSNIYPDPVKMRRELGKLHRMEGLRLLASGYKWDRRMQNGLPPHCIDDTNQNQRFLVAVGDGGLRGDVEEISPEAVISGGGLGAAQQFLKLLFPGFNRGTGRFEQLLDAARQLQTESKASPREWHSRSGSDIPPPPCLARSLSEKYLRQASSPIRAMWVTPRGIEQQAPISQVRQTDATGWFLCPHPCFTLSILIFLPAFVAHEEILAPKLYSCHTKRS